ncbi:M16 family metallopeptidase [Capillimicrobium parvum]|uniref:Zinc protease n=1 Tax=Capillimicrobium parvum TaxID=2884022 RepID=A0A9E6XZB7_9ACTN|nr:pitrilysin family protein [Capillimicrobium parvum]UGS36727.1 putative zinc protease [Capillimicrobium parvum]
MTDGVTLTELESGVRVITEAMPSVRSAALGFFIGTGSGMEAEAEAGLSHLLEHMLFRGTDRLQSHEIDELFDAMGAELNAGTGKESTSVYSRVLDVHLDEAFSVMADMVWRPALRDLETEREVVLEEIAMYEDDPQDKVFDVLGEAVFAGHPLGRAIIGRAEVISSIDRDGLAAFHQRHYHPPQVVVAAAGSLEHERIVELVREAEQRGMNGGRSRLQSAPLPPFEARTVFARKDTEQVHVCLGGRGIARDDDRRFALRVLDTILGGTSSSRLFQEVRERRGLAYAVYSFTALYGGTGQVGLYLGTRGDNLREALKVLGSELERFADEPATEAEIARAKENAKGRLVLSLESTASRMNRLGSAVLAGLPVLDVDEVLERIDAVTLDDVRALATELFAPGRLSAAGIGPDEDAFRAALAPLAVA